MIELRMWQAYYAKENVTLFRLLVTLLREQDRYSWSTAAIEGFRLARAAATFGSARGNYEVVLPDLESAYSTAHDWLDARFDPHAVAKAELAWWVARRTPRQNSPEHVGRLIADEYALLYETSSDRVLKAGLLRAQAAAQRDAEASRRDWDAIGRLLRESVRRAAGGAMKTRMRPFAGTMPLDEARAIIDQAIVPIERTESIRVLDANGRVLARDVAADADVPPFSRAAMDGYAVRSADTAGATRQEPGRAALRRADLHRSGARPRRSDLASASKSRPARRFQQAPMPSSSSKTPKPRSPTTYAKATVVKKADIRDSCVRVRSAGPEHRPPGRRYQPRTDGPSRGDLSQPQLAPARSPRSASPTVDVYARPRVAILSTGDEIVEPGARRSRPARSTTSTR